jgi:hypothetical protein
MIRPIRTEAEYDAALEEIERYFENEPKPDMPEADRFDLLALIVEDYERKRWPIDPSGWIGEARYYRSPCPALCRASTSFLVLHKQERGWPGQARP